MNADVSLHLKLDEETAKALARNLHGLLLLGQPSDEEEGQWVHAQITDGDFFDGESFDRILGWLERAIADAMAESDPMAWEGHVSTAAQAERWAALRILHATRLQETHQAIEDLYEQWGFYMRAVRNSEATRQRMAEYEEAQS